MQIMVIEKIKRNHHLMLMNRYQINTAFEAAHKINDFPNCGFTRDDLRELLDAIDAFQKKVYSNHIVK